MQSASDEIEAVCEEDELSILIQQFNCLLSGTSMMSTAPIFYISDDALIDAYLGPE